MNELLETDPYWFKTSNAPTLPCEIMPHLLLSAKREVAELSPLQLVRLGVTHVVNAAGRAGRTRTEHDYAAANISYLEARV
jgi:hypothetical protein